MRPMTSEETIYRAALEIRAQKLLSRIDGERIYNANTIHGVGRELIETMSDIDYSGLVEKIDDHLEAELKVMLDKYKG